VISALPFLLAAAVSTPQAGAPREAARITVVASAQIIVAEVVSLEEATDGKEQAVRVDRQVSKGSAKRVVEFF
jgi:hypothetical protein